MRAKNVHVKVGGHEHDPKGLGAGVVSVLHLVDAVHDAQDGAVLVIDEPESALHPSYQRKILKLFAEESKRLQIPYATHSPYMVDWDAILTGASLSRVHRPIGGYSKISSLKRETAAALAGFQKNLRNPHILGTNAKEVFFLSDGIILVEGQDDVVYFREMASQMGETFDGDFYGWGVGGAENMPKIVQLLQDLGFERVVGVVDNNKPAVREQMEKQFPSYKFLMLPAEDVRDKDGKDGKSIKGLCSSGGKIHEDRIEDVRKFFAGLRERLSRWAAINRDQVHELCGSRLVLCHYVRIWPKESFAVEMDHVVWVFRDPDFGFPGNVRYERLHGPAVLEGGDEHKSCVAAGE